MSIATSAGTPATATDERAVLDLLGQLYAAWGDADRYASFFTPDADYVAFDGSHAKGRQTIVEMHRPLFERFLKGTRLHSQSESVRFPAPDVALVHGMGAVVKAGPGTAVARPTLHPDPRRHQAGRWLAVHRLPKHPLSPLRRVTPRQVPRPHRPRAGR